MSLRGRVAVPGSVGCVGGVDAGLAAYHAGRVTLAESHSALAELRLEGVLSVN